MSQNDHTGLENLSNEELVKECFNTHNELTDRPLQMELAKRLDAAIDQVKLLDEWDKVDLSIGDVRDLQAHLIESTEQTVTFLRLLSEFDVFSVDYLRAALQAAKIINEAA